MADGSAIFQEHALLPRTVSGAIWPFNPVHWKPAHYHSQVEFLLVLRGRLEERVGRAIHAVHAGQLVWHLPGVEHELIGASVDCDFVVLQAEPDLCAEVGRTSLSTNGKKRTALAAPFFDWARDLGFLAAGRPVVELKRADRDRVLEACAVTCSNEHLCEQQVTERLHTAIACAWAATRDDHDDRRPNSLVELACCLMLEDPALERSVICQMLDVSESYLSRCFQRELGVAFVEQRARARVAAFCTQVARGGHNYLESALLAGFGSYSQLHRVFVELVGDSPREYFARGGRMRRSERRARARQR